MSNAYLDYIKEMTQNVIDCGGFTALQYTGDNDDEIRYFTCEFASNMRKYNDKLLQLDIGDSEPNNKDGGWTEHYSNTLYLRPNDYVLNAGDLKVVSEEHIKEFIKNV